VCGGRVSSDLRGRASGADDYTGPIPGYIDTCRCASNCTNDNNGIVKHACGEGHEELNCNGMYNNCSYDQCYEMKNSALGCAVTFNILKATYTCANDPSKTLYNSAYPMHCERGYCPDGACADDFRCKKDVTQCEDPAPSSCIDPQCSSGQFEAGGDITCNDWECASLAIINCLDTSGTQAEVKCANPICSGHVVCKKGYECSEKLVCSKTVDPAPVDMASLSITVYADGTWSEGPLIISASYTGRLKRYDYTNLGLTLLNLKKSDAGVYTIDVNFGSERERRQVSLDVLDSVFCPDLQELQSTPVNLMTHDDPENQVNVCALDMLTMFGHLYNVSVVIPKVRDSATQISSSFYIRDSPPQYMFSKLGPVTNRHGGLVDYTFRLTKKAIPIVFWPLQKYVYL